MGFSNNNLKYTEHIWGDYDFAKLIFLIGQPVQSSSLQFGFVLAKEFCELPLLYSDLKQY